MSGDAAGRLLVIGAVNVDLVVAADRLPGRGETVVGPSVSRHGGGKGANAAVAAARAGAQVRYCGAVGSDEMGASALAELRDEGVDVTDVATLENVATGMALIVVDPRGDNQIAVGAGANAAITPEVVRAAVERSAGWAQCALVSTEISAESVAAAVEAAAEHEIRCVVNPAPVLPSIVELLPRGPILTPNASELRDLKLLVSGEDSTSAEMSATDAAVDVASRAGTPVLVTLGGDGVLVADPAGETTALPAGVVDEVRDTTGAGDTFNGVFAASLAACLPIVDAARRGVAAASISVAHAGARSGMPRPEAIDRVLEGN